MQPGICARGKGDIEDVMTGASKSPSGAKALPEILLDEDIHAVNCVLVAQHEEILQERAIMRDITIWKVFQ